MPEHALSRRRLHRLLRTLSSPASTGPDDRVRAIQELQGFGLHDAIARLTPLLHHRRLDVRCAAAEMILAVDPAQGLMHVVPLLRTGTTTLRWHICGLLHGLGDQRAVAPLIERLEQDRDPHIRTTAAYALGGIASLRAIPALVTAEQGDHVPDIHGHSASSVAIQALSAIMMKQAIRLVEHYSTLHIAEEQTDMRIQAVVRLGGHGQRYNTLPWHARGPSAFGFCREPHPYHAPPFTVDIQLVYQRIVVRRRFLFGRDGGAWRVGCIIRPELIEDDVHDERGQRSGWLGEW